MTGNPTEKSLRRGEPAPATASDLRTRDGNATHPAVVEFLRDPATLDEGPVHVVETHAAMVFIGPRTALKIKRPVKYDYLDFSTLTRREAACRRELELNREAAPGIYRDVVAVTREPDGALAIGGSGETLEWAVRMSAFPEADILANTLDGGGLDDDIVKALAASIVRSHAKAPVFIERSNARPASQRFADVVTATCSGLADHPEHLERAVVDRVTAAMAAALHTAGPLLDARAAAGAVRRCHGDLHLGNIVLIDGMPTLFDALEFDEALATTDVLYDVAFLLMDLDHRGARRAANLLLGRYLWQTATDIDLDGLAALPLFLAQRALVRALVTAQKQALPASTRSGAQDDTPGTASGEANAYLAQADAYLRPTGSPVLLAIGGLSGTGKSTLASALAPALGRAPGAVHLRSDLERKAMLGVAETEHLPPDAYTPGTAAAVYARLAARAGRILAAGHSVVVDAVYALPQERAAIEAVARQHGSAFQAIWLTAALDVLQARVETRRGDASDATADVVAGQAARGAGEVAWPEVDAGGSPAQTLERAVAAAGPI